MISKLSKFPLRTEFLTFRRRAHRTASPHLTIYWSPATFTKMNVVVPKKLSKLATTRNWFKRTAYNTLWPLIKDKQLDCVVVYKPLPLKKSLSTQKQIISELNSAFMNLKS